MEICFSSVYQTIINNPLNNYQWSSSIIDKKYFDNLQNIPKNCKVIHLPIKFTKDELNIFFEIVKDYQIPIVVHPNMIVLEYLEQNFKKGNEFICIENFPYCVQKVLKTPLDILVYSTSYGFSITHDFAHVASDECFNSFSFLRSYLKYVKVIHFSGNQHEKMNDPDWFVWLKLFKNHPEIFKDIIFCLEHKEEENKIKDNKILSLLKEKYIL